MSFASPRDLVAALRLNLESARIELDRRFAEPISRLVEVACRRFEIAQPADRLVHHAMRWLEMYLRSLDPSDLDSLDECDDPWKVFVARMVCAAGRLLICEPESARPDPANPDGSGDDLHTLLSQMRTGRYETDAFCLARDLVAGDLIEHAVCDDTFWLLVADATGKSWPAYLAVRGVSSLWKTCDKSPGREPSGLLASLEELILPHLPEGIFVEAVLGRFAPSGQAVICSAGGNTLLLRVPKGAPATLRQLSGGWLGLDIEPRVQEVLMLEGGEEITFATDGLYDQPVGEKRLRETILKILSRRPAAESLHRSVVSLFERARHDNPQFDDVAIATVRTMEQRS